MNISLILLILYVNVICKCYMQNEKSYLSVHSNFNSQNQSLHPLNKSLEFPQNQNNILFRYDMGQACSNVELGTDRNRLMQAQNSQSRVEKIIEAELRSQFQRQKEIIKKITYMENSDELIYQFKDQNHTVEHLKVKKWVRQGPFQSIEIQRFLTEKSFIAKVKQTDQPQTKWKVFSVIDVKSLQNQDIIDFGLFYYNFSNLKQIQRMKNTFVVADSCSLKVNPQKQNRTCFIIESQSFTNEVVSLRQLGKYMRKNNIFWQDKEFLNLVKNCSRRMRNMHANRFYLFDDFLIDKSAKVFCIGAFVGAYDFLEKQINEDYLILAVYLLQTLFGVEVNVNSPQQLMKLIERQQNQAKFKRSDSLELIVNIYNDRQHANFVLHQEDSTQQFVNIDYYITSYKVRCASLEPTILLAKRYAQLGQFHLAKQVLFNRLSFVLYNKKQQSIKQNHKAHLLTQPNNSPKIVKSQMEQSFQLLEDIIIIEQEISKESESHELYELAKQYIKLGLILSYNARKKGNHEKSLSILKRVEKFITEDDRSWLLCLHLGQSYFLMGQLDLAQDYFMRSIQIQINEANVSFFIKFYASVLNWQKAITLIRSYQGLISQDFIFQLLISKSLLAKALCISPKLKINQEDRINTFNECIQVVRRIIDRKNVSQYVLSQAYEVLGDAHFYLMKYQEARNAYEKAETFLSSIGFRHSKPQFNKDMQAYVPTYIKNNEQQFTNSLIPLQYEKYLRSSMMQKSIQETLNFESFIQENQERQLSFLYQLKVFYNCDKGAVILSSIGNCFLMQKKFSEAIKKYEEAKNVVSLHNIDLKNSIVGNMAISFIEMGKNNIPHIDQSKINEGSNLLRHILNTTAQSTLSKLENDVNYVFLAEQLSMK